MCKVQSVHTTIPLVSGNEDNVVRVVVSNNNNFDESRAGERGSELKRGGEQERSTSIAGILLGTGIFALLFAFARSACLCSLHMSRGNDHTGDVFLRGAAMLIVKPSLYFHSPTHLMHQDSPQTDGSPEINVLLRSSFLRPIIPEAYSMESASGEGYEQRNRGSSPSFISQDGGHLLRSLSDDDESSDSMNASEYVTRTMSSEDDDNVYTRMSNDEEPEIATPMTPRRSILVPRNKDFREKR